MSERRTTLTVSSHKDDEKQTPEKTPEKKETRRSFLRPTTKTPSTVQKRRSGGSRPKKSIKIDTSAIEICERINTITSPTAELYSCLVSGWRCTLKQYNNIDRTFYDKWKKEIVLMEQLPPHPNIVRYLFHDQIKNNLRLFVSWFDRNLAYVIQERSKERSPFTVEEINRFLLNIIQGLRFLHSYQIIHRDISPENIYAIYNSVGEVSRLAVGNLESAKIITEKINAKTVIGTPAYMAPEVITARETGKYFFSADVYSLGMVLFSLMTLENPYADLPFLDATRRIRQNEGPNYPPHFKASEYGHLVELFKECTRFHPDERPDLEDIESAIKEGVSIKMLKKESQIPFSYPEGQHKLFEAFMVIGLPHTSRQSKSLSVLFQFPNDISRFKDTDQVIGFCFPHGGEKPTILKKSDISDVLLPSQQTLEKTSNNFVFLLNQPKTGGNLYGVAVLVQEPLDLLPSFVRSEGDLKLPVDDGYIKFTQRCYCLVTRYPFFDLHFSVLWSILKNEVKLKTPLLNPSATSDSVSHGDNLHILEVFLKTEIPKSSNSLSFSVKDKTFQIKEGIHTDHVFKWSLPILVQSLSLKNLMTFFTCCLLEKNVIIAGNDMGAISATVLSVIPLIRPYKWQGYIFPIATKLFTRKFDRNVSYILGIPKFDEKVENCVIINVSDNSVTIPDKFEIPKLPKQKQLLQKLEPIFKQKSNKVETHTVLEIFDQYHLSLIRQLYKNCTDILYPNQRALLNSQKASIRPFMKDFLQTKQYQAQSKTVRKVLTDEKVRKENTKLVEHFEKFFLKQDKQQATVARSAKKEEEMSSIIELDDSNPPKESMQTPKQKNGTLFVKLISCNKLLLPEYKYFYVVLTLETQQIRTPVYHSDTLDDGSMVISFATEYTFDVTQSIASVNLVVWGKKSMSAHCVGSLEISIKGFGLTDGKLQRKTFALKTHSMSRPTITLELQYTKLKPNSVDFTSFELLQVIGQGSFGKVYLAKKKDTGRTYAIKEVTKERVINPKTAQRIMTESEVMARLHHPFICNLKWAFQTPSCLYMVMDYLNGGELFYHLQLEDVFDEQRAKFYAAECVLALGFMHEQGIIYRDFKPENLVLDMQGHVSLVDFGLVKDGFGIQDTAHTVCGTVEYMAPEVVSRQPYGKEVDWWAFGILVYEMLLGTHPFYSENVQVMIELIKHSPISFSDSISAEAMDLLTRLLERDPKKRLGAGPDGTKLVQNHVWFRTIDWDALFHRQIDPPFKPHLIGDTEARSAVAGNELTSSAPIEFNIKQPRVTIDQAQFEGFSFDGGESEED